MKAIKDTICTSLSRQVSTCFYFKLILVSLVKHMCTVIDTYTYKMVLLKLACSGGDCVAPSNASPPSAWFYCKAR